MDGRGTGGTAFPDGLCGSGGSSQLSERTGTMRPVSATAQLSLEGLSDSGAEIIAKRSDALYGVHAYHTKVPPSALAGLIAAHTQPGELVLDPFCGSGMTGVAAALCGRRAFLNDLSPAAVHIAGNYTTPCEPQRFAAGVQRVLDRVGRQVASFYATTSDGAAATVEYLVWSDRRRCPKCSAQIVLWDRREDGLRALRCSSCGDRGLEDDVPHRRGGARRGQPFHGLGSAPRRAGAY